MKAPLISLLGISIMANSASAVIVTLNATADHSGVIRNQGTNVLQYKRPDSLWGTANGTISQRRNGLIEFESLDPSVQTGISNGTIIVNSVTLELWNTTNGWASTTLDFSRLADANTGWAALNGPDDGRDGVNSWNNINETDGTDWAGSTGAGNNTKGTPGQQIFGSLTSSNPGGTTLGATKWDVPLSGSEMSDWLSNPSIAPNLLASWQSGAESGAAQTRFATINTVDSNDEFAPNLVVDYTVIPEPGSLALLLLGCSSITLRRRRK